MSTQKLYAALIAAQREAATVPKDGKNDHFGFSYTKADTMYRCGKQILNNHGLALMPLGLELSSHEATGVVLVGNQRQVADLTEYDVTDKSVAAADTTLLSYAYRDLLALGRLGEGEVDALTPVADAKGAGTEPSPQDAKDLEAFIRERASARQRASALHGGSPRSTPERSARRQTRSRRRRRRQTGGRRRSSCCAGAQRRSRPKQSAKRSRT